MHYLGQRSESLPSNPYPKFPRGPWHLFPALKSIPTFRKTASWCLVEKGKHVSLSLSFCRFSLTGHKPEVPLLTPCVDFYFQPHLEAKTHKSIAKPDNSLLSLYVKGEKKKKQNHLLTRRVQSGWRRGWTAHKPQRCLRTSAADGEGVSGPCLPWRFGLECAMPDSP